MSSPFCSPAAFWGRPPPASLDLLLALNAPTNVVCSAALMIAAMMLPLAVAPLRHVHDRSFAKRRGRGMLLFLAGYVAVWMCAALGIQTVALAARWVAPTPLGALVVLGIAAILWQASPAKQWCLNRCHRRPQLAAFGAAANRDVFAFGLANGVFCAGTCWALMLLPLTAGSLHLLGMAFAALFVFAERLERPAPLGWRWRGPRKAFRIAAVQLRMILGRTTFATPQTIEKEKRPTWRLTTRSVASKA